MAIAQPQFTVDDLERLPEDGSRYEVIDGELYVTAAPHSDHQAALDRIIQAFLNWRSVTRLGWSVSGAGIKFDRNSGVVPDFCWFSKERFSVAVINPESDVRDGKYYAAPDLAVEILSPGRENEERDRVTKLTLYARRGVHEYWIVDRFSETIDVYRRDTDALVLATTLTMRDTLESPLLPGFALSVAQVFELDLP